MSESSKNPPGEGINRSTEDVDQEFYQFLTSDSETLLRTGIRLARKKELILQELLDRGDIS